MKKAYHKNWGYGEIVAIKDGIAFVRWFCDTCWMIHQYPLEEVLVIKKKG